MIPAHKRGPKEWREQSESPLPGPQAGTLALGVSSVMRLAHDSSFCGRSQGGDFASAEARRGHENRRSLRSPRHPFGAPNLYLYGAQRWKGAAALSAAVTTINLQGIAPNFQGCASVKKTSTQTPATLREGVRGRRFS